MSLSSWKATFYQVPAQSVPKERALAHSLRKWRGMIASARRRHKVAAVDGVLEDARDEDVRAFAVDSSTCALCVHYFNADSDDSCETCPLAIVRGGVSCDALAARESSSPFGAWENRHDPRPMIRWLERAEAMLEQQQKKRTNSERNA